MQFTLFPQLPAELRSQIWRTAFCEQRSSIIELRALNDEIRPKSRPSTVLCVNRESRQEALRASRALSSEGLLFRRKGEEEAQNRLFLFPEQDIIYFSNDYQFASPSTVDGKMEGMAGTLSLLAASMSPTDRAKIQSLAIDIYEWTEAADLKEIFQELVKFEGLKALVAVMRDPVEKKLGTERIFVEWPWSQRKPAQDLQTKLWKISRHTLRYNLEWKEPTAQVVCLGGN